MLHISVDMKDFNSVFVYEFKHSFEIARNRCSGRLDLAMCPEGKRCLNYETPVEVAGILEHRKGKYMHKRISHEERNPEFTRLIQLERRERSQNSLSDSMKIRSLTKEISSW